MMTEKTPPALGDDWPAIAAHAAHHDITNPAGALASWRALNEDRRIAWRASADAVRMLLDAKPAPDPRVHALDPALIHRELRELTDTHERLIEEILQNADEDINGGDEAPEYLAEKYVRYLEERVDELHTLIATPEPLAVRPADDVPADLAAVMAARDEYRDNAILHIRERDEAREQLDRCAGLLGTANHTVSDLRALVAEICDDLDRLLAHSERIVLTAEDVAEYRQRARIGDGQ